MEVSVYNNYMHNFIFLFPNPIPVLTLRGAFPSFSYEQANSVLRGVDGSIEYRATEWYQVGTTFSLVRGQNLVTDEPLYQMPADRIRLSNTFYLPSLSTFTNSSLEFAVTLVRKQDRYPANVDYLPPPPGYILADINYATDITIGAQQFQCSLSVHNLFNASYRDYLSRFRYYIDEPGRDVVLRLNIPFGAYNQRTAQ
jgi:iron complex outermembrane receptor protein